MLTTIGPGWYGETVHVEIRRESDGVIFYHGQSATIASGQSHWWGVKLPPGNYHATAFDGDKPTLAWDFTVIR